MPAELSTLLIFAVGLSYACLFGYIAQWLKLSPILGYLLAGYLIGPHFPGYVADPYMSEQLANIGITLLLFAVGLHFHWKDLIKVKNIALPGGLFLSFLSIILGFVLSYFLGETIQASLIIGVAICVSSTVVIVRMLTDQNLLFTMEGHIVVGWTIVEDLISIFALLLLPAISQVSSVSLTSITISVLFLFLKLIALGVIVYFGEFLIHVILKNIARTRSHELFTLAILSLVFLIAAGSSYMFGVSIALGAFIAGTVVGKSDVSHQAAANALPMKDAFAVIFFLSVGMLFNPMAIGENLPLFFGILSLILLIRPLIAYLMLRIVKYPTASALTIALVIGQIGEYSFILVEEGARLNILPEHSYDILIACALISIAVNPLLFQLFRPTLPKTAHKIKPEAILNSEFSELTDSNSHLKPKAIIVGYGPMGQTASHYLEKKGYKVVIIDQNVDTVSTLKQFHIEALFGDATQPQLMELANLEDAQIVVITVNDVHVTKSIIQTIQHLNPYVQIFARSRFKSDLEQFEFVDVPVVCDEEISSEKMIDLLQNYTQAKQT